MTPTLTPVRPGLHRQMLDFSQCHWLKAKPIWLKSQFGDGAESRCCDDTPEQGGTADGKEEKPFGDGAESRCCDETPEQTGQKISRLERARRADAAMKRLSRRARR